MVELIGDEHLTSEERWARHLLESAIGPTRVIDRSRKGGQQGQHDLEADLPDGRIAAIEITSEVDGARRSVADAAQRHLSKVKVPGSKFWWIVQVTPHGDARALRRSGYLVALLIEMERQGLSSLTTLSDYRIPLRDRLKELGIQSVDGIASRSDRLGTVTVMPAIVLGWGWVGLTVDSWITDFLASKLGKDHVNKLERAADASERHLVVVLDPPTDAGLGIASALGDLREGAVGEGLPSVVPPSPPLTHLWLMAPTVPPKAFCWTHNSGWAVVEP